MSDPPFDQQQAERWFAVELNNRAWDLLESPVRTDAETEALVHMAHASCYHWLQVGTAVNQARAECLIANAYAASGNGAEAVSHASRCLELTKVHADEVADWDLAFAYDCLARAKAASGEKAEANDLKRVARNYGDKIAHAGERKVFDGWFSAGNWHGVEGWAYRQS